MLYRHHIDHCLGPYGLRREALDAATARLAPAIADLKARRAPLASALLSLPSRTDDLEAIEAFAADIRARYKHLVILGAGGAGLSGQVLTQLQPKPWPVSLHFLDNIDPHAMEDCLASIDLARTCFLAVSKSGSTVETLSQTYVLFEQLRQNIGHNAAEHFAVITTPGDNPLSAFAREHAIRSFDYARDIGGRFSVLVNVGLLPAAVCGVDIRALRAGAQTVVAALDAAAAPQDFAPAIGAALQYCFLQQGHNISVMLPYSSRLSGFSSWYRQSWSESLGKSAQGSTPIRAVGTTDQHSQLQLYLDGPKDKLFHLITLARTGSGMAIPTPSRADLAYLRGKTVGDVMEAEQRATFETLIHNGCPVRHIEIDTLKEAQLGALIMHFTLEIMCMAALQNVNPFDQPAVEQGKILARDYLLSGNL